jgi:hypothetical protein
LSLAGVWDNNPPGDTGGQGLHSFMKEVFRPLSFSLNLY